MDDRIAAKQGQRRVRWVAALVFWLAAITASALLDQLSESEAALEEYAEEQVLLARATARLLDQRAAEPAWSAAQRAARAQRLLSELHPAGQAVLLLFVSDDQALYGARGRVVSAPLQLAMSQGARVLRLARTDAARLGLPARTAVAGFARSGRDGIAVVASAARERDRARRGQWRFVLSVVTAAAVFGVFGWAMLRRERRQLELERALDRAALRDERNAQLARESRAATMLTLATGVAHEVSTPLSVIAGRAEQLQGARDVGERVRRSAGAIVAQSQRIREIVVGFLDLARGGEPSRGSVDLRVAATTALALVSHRFADRGVDVRSEIAPRLPPVHGDARLLEQALVNLLLNACDACAPGGRVVLAVARAGRHVRLVVEDDGVGISDANAARVLEPFFSTKPHGQGTGLGLAVTREIAAIHHGTLALEPHAPRGTRAILSIPLPAESANVE